MTPSVYLCVGALLLLTAAVAVRRREGSLVTPGGLLLLFYGLHCFLDPTMRYLGVHRLTFNPLTWETLTVYNTLCFGALTLGYLLPRRRLARDKERYLAARPARMFGRTGFALAALGCALVLGVLFVSLGALGRFSLPPVVFNTYRPPAYELLVSLYPILYIIVPALAVSAFFDGGGRARRWVAGALVAGVALFTMATLGRGMIFAVLLTIGIVWHFRYRRFLPRHVLAAVGLVGAVTFVALLRRAGVGLAGIDLETVRYLALSGALAFLDGFFAFTVMISEGQITLSGTIAFVEETGLYHGRTYLDTVLSRTVPFYAPALPQPKVWYEMLTSRFGHDFSILAESYMNFGRAGCVVFLGVGALARRLSLQVYTARNPVLLLWSAWMIVVLVLATRGDSVPLFMRAVWYIVPLIALRGFFRFLDASARGFAKASRGTAAPASSP